MLLLFTFQLILQLVYSQIPDITVPDAKIEVFYPEGLRISIPDLEKDLYPNIGIKLFAIHANINKKIGGIGDGGSISKDISSPEYGRWTFYDHKIELKIGDIIYYWTYMIYNDGVNTLGYPRVNLTYVVKEYANMISTYNNSSAANFKNYHEYFRL